eukprot:7709179-Pyramimonas_sp.AAC.1
MRSNCRTRRACTSPSRRSSPRCARRATPRARGVASAGEFANATSSRDDARALAKDWHELGAGAGE